MPRNSTGVYTLPPSNPVVPFTTVATSWANPTLSDIGQALTDSLDRTGRGGMLAPFKIFDGTIGQPGLGFLNEPSLGIYRSGTGIMDFVSGGVTGLQIAVTGAISPVKLAHWGPDTFHATGYVTFKVTNELGVMNWVPSATIDSEDWDTTKGMTWDGTTGSMVIKKNLQVLGTIFAGTWGFTDITCTTLTASGDITTSGSLNAVDAAFSGNVAAKHVALTPYSIGAATGLTNWDWNNGQSQLWTQSGPVTISPTNLPNGSMMRIVLFNTNLGVTWTGVVWPLGSVPNLANGPLKIANVVVENANGNYIAQATAY